MKQHITKEQLNELTPAQRQRYEDWIGSKVAATTTVWAVAEWNVSIGHLIWFLDEHIDTGWWSMNKSSYPKVWTVMTKDDVGIEEADRKELIDALWEAVKAVLSLEEEQYQSSE